MSAARPLRRLPGALMLATIVVSLALREWYPFSFFPMYASFGPESWHVRVTDAHNAVVPTGSVFGVDARPFKRMYEQRMLANLAAGQPPREAEVHAAETLLQISASAAAPTAPLPDRLVLWIIYCRVTGPDSSCDKRPLGAARVR